MQAKVSKECKILWRLVSDKLDSSLEKLRAGYRKQKLRRSRKQQKMQRIVVVMFVVAIQDSRMRAWASLSFNAMLRFIRR